jgi:hypothetical protein
MSDEKQKESSEGEPNTNELATKLLQQLDRDSNSLSPEIRAQLLAKLTSPQEEVTIDTDSVKQDLKETAKTYPDPPAAVLQKYPEEKVTLLNDVLHKYLDEYNGPQGSNFIPSEYPIDITDGESAEILMAIINDRFDSLSLDELVDMTRFLSVFAEIRPIGGVENTRTDDERLEFRLRLQHFNRSWIEECKNSNFIKLVKRISEKLSSETPPENLDSINKRETPGFSYKVLDGLVNRFGL